jgi:uncharacterized membrane protein YhhN
MTIIILSIFILISACLHIYYEINYSLKRIYIFKSLSISLIIALAFSLGNLNNQYQLLIITGLIFSLFGDIFLISENRFIAGLISFLIAHLFYISAFVLNTGVDASLYLPSIIPFLIFAVIILKLINGRLGQLKIPVIFYLLVIVSMGWQSLNQLIAIPNIYSVCALIGAIFFTASDSMIAIDKFKGKLKHARLLIMSTYYVGQWLIALSILGIKS